jgi:hypothetical protein
MRFDESVGSLLVSGRLTQTKLSDHTRGAGASRSFLVGQDCQHHVGVRVRAARDLTILEAARSLDGRLIDRHEARLGEVATLQRMAG